MAFIRFGVDGSQVYIFESDRGKECCGCALRKVVRQRTDEELADLPLPDGFDPEVWRDVYEPDFVTDDLDAMLAHVQAHRDAGHRVPDWLDQSLRDEWNEE